MCPAVSHRVLHIPGGLTWAAGSALLSPIAREPVFPADLRAAASLGKGPVPSCTFFFPAGADLRALQVGMTQTADLACRDI